MNKTEVLICASLLPVTVAGLLVSHADARVRATADLCSVMIRMAVYPGYLRRRRGVNLDTTISVDLYASLVKVLPVESEWSLDCRKGLQRIEAWARMHKPTSEAYPANEVIRVMRWNCGAGSR